MDEASMVARTMRHEVVDNTVLIVQGPCAPAAEEWSAQCRDCNRLDYGGVLVVVDRDCPGPSSRQRMELAGALRDSGRFPSIAIVTDSPAHRGIITVMNWMQSGTIKAYGPARFAEALKYAGVAPSARAAMLRRVHELAVQLNAQWILRAIALHPAQELTP